MTRRVNITRGKTEFIHMDNTWYLQYEWICTNNKYSYGLRLRYKETGTGFKYITNNSMTYDSELEMKKAIKKEVSKWLLDKQKKHDIKSIPVCQVQELVSPQLKLFKE